MHRKPKNAAVATTSNPPLNLPTTTQLQIVLRVPEFGCRYSVSPRTVWSWLADGLPHYKVSSRQTRIPVVEADAWVNQYFSRKRKRR